MKMIGRKGRRMVIDTFHDQCSGYFFSTSHVL